MKNLLTFLFFTATLIACSNDTENNEAKEDSDVVTEPGIETTGNTALVPFTELISFLEKSDSSFSTANFQEFSAAAAIDTLAAAPVEKEHLAQYAAYFIYNEDSSLAIDPYSYNHVIVKKDEGTKLTNGSPDTEVAIVDFREGKRQRILYFGPSYMLIDAKWREDKTVLFAISELIESDKISPEIWEVDLNTFTKKVSRYPDTLTINVNTYKDQKLSMGKG